MANGAARTVPRFEATLDRGAPGVSHSGVHRSRCTRRRRGRAQDVARPCRPGHRTTVTAVSLSGIRRAVVVGMAGAMFIVLAGTTYQGVATALERRQLPHPGRLIDV